MKHSGQLQKLARSIRADRTWASLMFLCKMACVSARRKSPCRDSWTRKSPRLVAALALLRSIAPSTKICRLNICGDPANSVVKALPPASSAAAPISWR